MMNFFIFLAAEAATEAVKVVADGAEAAAQSGDVSFWKTVAAFFGGVVFTKVILWVVNWIDGKGAKLVQDQLSKFEQKLDNTSVGAQIAADNALFDIAKNAIPEVTALLAENVKKDLEDGKFDKINWEDIGTRLWQVTKPQIQGGVNDYIKTSSFKDGQVAMAWIAKKLFHKDAADKAAEKK